MSQETIIAASGVIISLAVGAVIFWYTLETRKLRKQSENQTKLIAEQTFSSIRPFVFCHVSAFDPGGSGFSKSPVNVIKPGFRGTVWNPTDRVAHDLRILVRHNTGYFWSEDPPVIMRTGDTVSWEASGPVPNQEPLKLPEFVYGGEKTRYQINFLQERAAKNEEYLAIFFRDVNDNVYTYFGRLVRRLNDFHIREPLLLREEGLRQAIGQQEIEVSKRPVVEFMNLLGLGLTLLGTVLLASVINLQPSDFRVSPKSGTPVVEICFNHKALTAGYGGEVVRGEKACSSWENTSSTPQAVTYKSGFEPCGFGCVLLGFILQLPLAWKAWRPRK